MKKARILYTAVFVALLALAMSASYAVEPLVMFDFEGNDEGQVKGGEATTEQAKTGKGARKWTNHVKSPYLTFEMIPEDWSEYNQISFWLFSGVANDAEFIIQMMSENEETEGGDYFIYEIKVDWTGWKHFELPFWKINKARQPAGWDKISKLSFIATGWNNEPKEDTLLYVDDIRLEKAPVKLENASLEDENGDGVPDGWYLSPPPKDGATQALVVDDGRTGNGFKLVDKDPKQGVGLRQTIRATPGQNCTFSVWKKGDPVMVYLLFTKADKSLDQKNATRKNADPGQFEKLSVSATVPEGTVKTEVWIYSYSAMLGESVTDDAEIEVTD